MKQNTVLLTTSLVICLVVIGVGIYFYISQNNSLDAANQDLASTKKTLDTTKQNLGTMTQSNSQCQADKTSLQTQFATFQKFLSFNGDNLPVLRDYPGSLQAGGGFVYSLSVDDNLQPDNVYVLKPYVSPVGAPDPTAKKMEISVSNSNPPQYTLILSNVKVATYLQEIKLEIDPPKSKLIVFQVTYGGKTSDNKYQFDMINYDVLYPA